MQKLIERKPRTLTEFVEIIENIQSSTKHNLWYRGCTRSSYTLTPRLYRHSTITKVNDLVELEYSLMNRFRQRSVPFHNKSLEDDWESLFFMQHYGVPTRLLDWTENPFIAFYFAVTSHHYEKVNNRLKFLFPAAIWILNPKTWNEYALRDISFDRGILSTDDEQVKGYIPVSKFGGMRDLPIAIYGTHNSNRIVAQRGVFTIFGQNKLPMEHLYKKTNFPNNSLIKIILNKSVLPKLREAIFNNGITESVVFPDLEGLAKEIRREFKFEL